MQTVKMFASVAGEEVFCGECHPARARILVKKEVASWKDGNVLLHVLGVHDALLVHNPGMARGPLDDENVSKQEMERRLAWFRSFLVKSSEVLAQETVKFPTPEEAAEWASSAGVDEPEAVPMALLEVTVAEGLAEDARWHVVEVGGKPSLVREDYDDEVERMVLMENVALADVWKSDPDVSKVFMVPPPSPFLVTEEQHRARVERDRAVLEQERAKEEVPEEPELCGNLAQVRLWRYRVAEAAGRGSAETYSILVGTSFKLRP